MKIEKLEDDFPDCFELIKEVQPFRCGKSWFFYQHHIASERHSDPQVVYKGNHKKGITLIAPGLIGKEFKASIDLKNGDRQFVHIRRYGVPDRDPPVAIIEGKEEAISFIENCISGTNNIINGMIYCFERRL